MSALWGMSVAQLEAWARARGAGAGAARTLGRFLVARLAGREQPTPARALLALAERELQPAAALPEAEVVHDPDGTVRFAVKLADGNLIETVLIHQAESETRARARWTVCVSSQVGCTRGCTFCETGSLGLLRNLSAAEIVAQYALAARAASGNQGVREGAEKLLGAGPPRNLVFMGMGEPLDNLEEVLQAIAVLREPVGFAVPERRITVSTVGIVPRMDELYARGGASNVAVSLHALEPAVRRSLLPVARKWPLADLRAAIARSPRPVLLQWTLISGVNDRASDADALVEFARGLEVRVNLIPLNPGPRDDQRAPPPERSRAFQKRLLDQGLRALLRLPHGQAVGGACGQLAGARRNLRP